MSFWDRLRRRRDGSVPGPDGVTEFASHAAELIQIDRQIPELAQQIYDLVRELEPLASGPGQVLSVLLHDRIAPLTCDLLDHLKEAQMKKLEAERDKFERLMEDAAAEEEDLRQWPHQSI